MKVKFWGTRGSIPVPQPEAMRYGGETPCVEVRTASGAVLFFDGGTGIRRAGLNLLRTAPELTEGTIFLSHLHWDHIQGLPFFPPLHIPRYRYTVYGPIRIDQDLEHRLGKQMSELFFPVTLAQVQDHVRFEGIVEEPITLGPTVVTPRHLDHPEGVFGYRIEDGGRVLVYASDVEQPPDAPLSEDIRILAQDADVLIFDAQYTPDEYESHRGWGHSTWKTATEVARELGVGKLVLFHHEPNHSDDQIDAIVEAARAEFPNTVAASRDMELEV